MDMILGRIEIRHVTCGEHTMSAQKPDSEIKVCNLNKTRVGNKANEQQYLTSWPYFEGGLKSEENYGNTWWTDDGVKPKSEIKV